MIQGLRGPTGIDGPGPSVHAEVMFVNRIMTARHDYVVMDGRHMLLNEGSAIEMIVPTASQIERLRALCNAGLSQQEATKQVLDEEAMSATNKTPYISEVSGFDRMDAELEEIRAENQKLREVLKVIATAYDYHMDDCHGRANRDRATGMFKLRQTVLDSLEGE